MSLVDQIPQILEHIEEHKTDIGFNETIFEILEGDLLSHVDKSLKIQLSESSYKSAMERVAPINLFRKVNDKLSTVYVEEATRKVSTDIDGDQELVDEYSDIGDVNQVFEDLNRALNAYKWTVCELYHEDNKVMSRTLPSHLFLPYGGDKVNPTRVNAIIKFMGDFEKVPEGKKRSVTKQKYWITSNDEFLAIDSDGELIVEDMEDNDGINDYGIMPYIFISKSRYLLVPKPDKDDLKMSLLFPVLLTDLNFAAKFLAHSIFYGIDIDSENLKLSPDAVWIFKSDIDGKKPEVGTIKPEVSIQDVLMLAKEQVSSWVETKNIKVGNLGSADGKSLASGVAKLIDEADTTTERKRQIKVFRRAEREYWKVLAVMHNYLVDGGIIKNKRKFSDPYAIDVQVVHGEQRTVMSRKERIEELKLERDAGFKSTFTAIKELNPTMGAEMLEEELALIEEERTVYVSNTSNIMTDDEEMVDDEQVDRN